MSEAKLLEKINKNSGMIEIIVKTAVAVAVAIISVTMFLGDVKDIIEKIPPKVETLEARVTALELNFASSLAKIESSLSRLEGDFNIIKTQLVKQGMETRVIYEYPHKELDYKYGKDK